MFNLFLSKILSFLADATNNNTLTNVGSTDEPIGYDATWWHNTLEPIADLLGEILVPLLIALSTAGSVYAIVLGVAYSKAESGEKRDEAKKRLVNVLIGFVVLLVLLILLILFCKNVVSIGKWVTDIVNNTRTNNTGS